jgi:hypothetical protein
MTTSSARRNPGPPAPPPLPSRRSSQIPDGIELTDEDLEVVVGGLSPEASMAYANWITDQLYRESPVY